MTDRAARAAASLGAVVLLLAGCIATPGSPAQTDTVIEPSPGGPTATPAGAATPDPAATVPPEPPASRVTLEPIVEGLEQPVAVAVPDDGTGDMYVVEQAGRILRLPGGSAPAEVALDIRDRVGSGGERGLLGLAFHPAVADDGRLFVDYTDRNGDTVIAEFRLEAGRIDPS
ncbi:MAG: hypothetical protein ABWY52_01070, partial [Candidatus Limnocylindrales bacterium]